MLVLGLCLTPFLLVICLLFCLQEEDDMPAYNAPRSEASPRRVTPVGAKSKKPEKID